MIGDRPPFLRILPYRPWTQHRSCMAPLGAMRSTGRKRKRLWVRMLANSYRRKPITVK